MEARKGEREMLEVSWVWKLGLAEEEEKHIQMCLNVLFPNTRFTN